MTVAIVVYKGLIPVVGRILTFNMVTIQKEEAAYVLLPKFYTFKSRDVRERILYANFIQVNKDVKDMINEIFQKKKAI